MKICFITNEYSHPELPAAGGIGTFVKTLSESLVKNDHEVYIIGYSTKALVATENGIYFDIEKSFIPYRSLVFRIIQKIFVVLRISFLLIPLYRVDKKRLAKRVSILAKTKNIDIFEGNDYNGDCAYVKINSPLIIRCHGTVLFFSNTRKYIPNLATIHFEKLAFKQATSVIAVSNYTAERTKLLFSLNKVDTIYNGISPKLFPFVDYSERDIDLILYFGSINKIKGLIDLCNIFNAVVQVRKSAKLMVIGKGEKYWRTKCIPLLNEGALKQTEYIGPVDYKSLHVYLKQASVIVFPTYDECFPMTWLEAMSTGRPLVVSNIKPAKESIGNEECGYIVERTDYQEFANKIIMLLDNPEIAADMGRKGNIRVANLFNNLNTTAKTIEHYKKLQKE